MSQPPAYRRSQRYWKSCRLGATPNFKWHRRLHTVRTEGAMDTVPYV